MSRAGGRNLVDRLGVRLGLVIGIALLPVGAVAVAQASALLAEARARGEAALAGETLRAVRPRLALIKRAQGVAEGLAAFAPALGCAGLRGLVEASDYAFAGYYATDGRLICGAGDAPGGIGGQAGVSAMLTEPAPGLSLYRAGGQVPLMLALHPMRDVGDVVRGFVAVAPSAALGPMTASDTGGEAAPALFVFDAAGAVVPLGADRTEAVSMLPGGQRLQDLPEQEGATFTALSAGGQSRAYALVPLVDGTLYVLGTTPAEPSGLAVMRDLPPLLLPALMWGLCLVVAWFAAEYLVARHIRRLRSAIRDFASGDRVVRPLGLQGAPKEIRDTGAAFERMTDTILRDEAEMEDMLREKEVLLREVHHRVKNNLQLIASIVNMQIRRTRSDEARSIMRALQERMVSLATIHNGLYQTAELSAIDVGTLLPGIIEQVMRNAQVRGQAVALESNLEPMPLTLDQAVPLALLVTEALSNALKHASTADGSAPRMVVTFRVERDRRALIEVSNSASGRVGADEGDRLGTGIGTQLLRGFAKQLNGELLREFAGGMCHVRVWFSVAARADAA